MREIKFKKALYNFNTNKYEIIDDIVIGNGIWENNSISINTILGKTKHLMQYTGLKDKNGKEIYEGDIITRGFDDYDEYCEVVYDYAICSLRAIKSNAFRPLNISKNKTNTHWCAINNGSSMYDFEVIGNIYENPELLEQ